MKIVKVIYEDGTENSLSDILPLEKSDDKKEQWKNLVKYNRQFTRFEEDILDSLDEDTVEDYACEKFYLVKEDDVEKTGIGDFNDDELMKEVRGRKLFGNNTSIISENFVQRFYKIVEKENLILLDNLLSDFEKKLNI